MTFHRLERVAFALAGAVAVLAATNAGAGEGADDPARIEFFEKKIRPVLVEHCYKCHSAGSTPLQGGLLLDSRDGARQGGESGHAVVPGDVDASLLIAALKYDAFEMPPDGKLPEQVISDFVKWIEMGAPDPREKPAATISASPSMQIDWEEARSFWAFQPPLRHAPPKHSQADWPRTSIDPFILARLDEEGLAPGAPAEPRRLIRRLTFDLIGLPPTTDDVERFLAEYAANPDAAVSAAVERLMQSPHFGERWAALWLDVMRYAEDQAHIVGNNKALFYPNAWRYRDWVIAALNSDMPYDEFLRRQIAADHFYPDDSESHVALGFLGLGPKYYRRGSPEVMAEEWENQVDTLTQGVLGLTVACARCHDHKFDPISTEDYYALAGVFAGTEMFNRPLNDSVEVGKNGGAAKPEVALHIVRDAKPRDLNVMIRGNVESLGPVVPRGFLQVLCDSSRTTFTEGSGRRELAEAIAASDNPLTARVIVNRVWGQMFGRGLVGTPSNFGELGERPTHPELLDDLAARFMEHGWSLKWLLSELATSATYRQASRVSEAAAVSDPGNRLLSHMPRRRLSVEQWRDAILAASGRLDGQVGGESIDPSDPEATRRTVYAERSRLEIDAMLKTFDFPDANVHAARRVETTTPLQMLFALNSPWMLRQAESVAKRVESECSGSARERIGRLYAVLYGRPPTTEEADAGADFVDGGGDWTSYVQVLLASNELMYLD